MIYCFCSTKGMRSLEVEYILVCIASLPIVGNYASSISSIGVTVLLLFLYFFCYQYEIMMANCMQLVCDPDKSDDKYKQRKFFQFLKNGTRVCNGLGLWLLVYLSLLLSPDDTVTVIGCLSFCLWVTLSILTKSLDCPYICVSVTVSLSIVSCILSSIHSDTPWTNSTLLIYLVLLSHVAPFSCIYCIPKSFTVGEAQLIAQLALLFTYRYYKYTPTSFLIPQFQIITKVAVSLTLFLLFCLLFTPLSRRPKLLAVFTITGGCMGLLYANSQLILHDSNLITFIFEYLMKKGKNVACLLMFWILCVFASGLFLVYYMGECCKGVQFTTSLRKFFHFTSALVAISGLQYDVQLTFMSSVVIFCCFLLVEAVRWKKVGSIGVWLDWNCRRYLDGQDQGDLVLTPIYLLVGLFIPLWLYPVASVHNVKLYHYSGIATVGVGDSFASIIGSKYGCRKWPNSKKTLLGTFAGFVSMLFFLMLVAYILRVDIKFSLFITVTFKMLICALIETFSGQIDNLVLPLVAIRLLLQL